MQATSLGNLDAVIGGACERLHDGPVCQDIGRHVDFELGAIDPRKIDMFEDSSGKLSALVRVNPPRALSRSKFFCKTAAALS